jgi:hypothetical protein
MIWRLPKEIYGRFSIQIQGERRASILPSSEPVREYRNTSKWASLSLLAGDFTISSHYSIG